MSDNYEFHKSLEQQSSASETPYSNLQWQYINDLNNGIYSNGGGLTLIQWDLSSLYNSNNMIDMKRAYLTIPIQLVTALSTIATPNTILNPVAGYGWCYAGLKNSYTTLIHACELQVGGQTIEQYQPYNSNYTFFKLASMMSQDDLNSLGTTLGWGRALDNPESLRYNSSLSQPSATAVFGSATATNPPFGGNGLVNNTPFGAANPNFGDQTAAGPQVQATAPTVYNQSYFNRLIKVIDTNTTQSTLGSVTSPGTMWGNNGIETASNFNTEFRPTYSTATVGTQQFGVVTDTLIIRLCDIMDSMNHIPLTKRFAGNLRIYVNTGMVAATNLATGGYGMVTSASANSFSNTCPLMISALPFAAYTSTSQATQITAALGVGRWSGGNIQGCTIPALSAFQMQSCRLYYPQVTLKPEKLRFYQDQGLNRKVCYTSYYFNQFNGISAGSTFSQLIQSGVKRPRGLLILPFLSAQGNSGCTGAGNGTIAGALPITGITPFADQLSPFSTAPCTTGSISLSNIQVSVGGVNFLQNVLQCNWESFLEQSTVYEKINGFDLGVKCGLFNQFYFDNAYRAYYVDLSRGTLADELTDRTISASFLNNSNATIDAYTFLEYFNEFEINIENGIVKK